MELNDAYILSNIINEKINEGVLDKSVLDNLTVGVAVTPTILYGIDKEFYRISHDDSLEGFKHAPKVFAKIDGINFVFESVGKAVKS